MASKIYTSKEMRSMADKLDNIESGYALCHYDDEWRPLWMKPNPVVLALRQAAVLVADAYRVVPKDGEEGAK